MSLFKSSSLIKTLMIGSPKLSLPINRFSTSINPKFITPPTGQINENVWKLGRLNHVAIAVPDIEQSTKFYKEVLGAEVSSKEALPEHGVYTVFVNLENTKIELLHPYGDNSPIQKFLDKNKSGGIHHICIEVDDVFKALEDLTSQNIRSLDKKPKIGAHGKPVIFLHPKDCGGVLVELEQKD